MSVTQVADAYGVDRCTLHRWLARYEREGDAGLARRPGSGRPRKLGELGEDELRGLVLTAPGRFGFETDLWTVARLHAVVTGRLGVAVSRDTVWRRLREAGLTYRKPERQYWQADEKARQEWLRGEVPRIRRAVRRFRAILYFQDEANVSLAAFLGKTWALRGVTPKVKVSGARGGVAAMSAIASRGHLLFRLYEKRIASAEVIAFLAQMLRHHRRRHLVVVMDQAPDWNPDEKVWNYLKHHELKAHCAKDTDELRLLTNQKLLAMSNNRQLIRGLFFRCCVADFFG